MIAGALVLSAAPSWAISPDDPTLDAPSGVEHTETELQQPDSDIASDDSSSADANETPSESDELAAADEQLELPVDQPTSLESAVPLTQAPNVVDISGELLVVSGEPSVSHGADDAVELNDMSADRTLVATDAGPIVPVDSALVGEGAITGDRFEGQMALSGDQKAAVEATINNVAGGESLEPGLITETQPAVPVEAQGITSEQVIEVAVANASETGEGLAVIGALAEEAPAAAASDVAGAAARRSHAADVLYIGSPGQTKPSSSSLSTLITRSSSYWNEQTNGAVSSISVSPVKYATSSFAYRCDSRNLDRVWGESAKVFGRTAASYTNTGRHLVVVVDDDCGDLAQGAAGWGTIGSLHSGGLTWIDAGTRGDLAFEMIVGTVVHEIGHNLGLGHANMRTCSGTAVDSSSGKAPCRTVEYGDEYNVMGIGSWTGGIKPPAISIAQKDALGVLAAGQMKTVTAAGGPSQRIALAPAGSKTGLRGLKVVSPTGGTTYVEHRSKSGADSNVEFSSARPNEGWPAQGTFVLSTGVRAIKGYNSGGKASVVIGVRDSYQGKSGLFQNARTGKTLTSFASNAKVYVDAANTNSATVTVQFTPFTDVPWDHSFAKEINWMSSSGMSYGYASGKTRVYKPTGSVTRQAMAAFLYRLKTPAGKKAPAGYTVPKTTPFSDVSKKHQYYKEIAWMNWAKISFGTAKKNRKPTFAPTVAVSRQAMAAFLYRMDKTKKPAKPKSSPFKDVSTKDKYYKEIAWMYQTGLSNGTKHPGSKPTYAPKVAVSRQAMAAFLYRYEH